jgi:hypothetical protein
MVITAIFMPLVLYWFLKWAANDLHHQAMREQADLVAHYLVLRADGSWTLDLPPALQDVYSQAVGRYAYAVLDDTGRVLFSSLKDRSPIFSADPRSSDVAYLEARHGTAAVSGRQPREGGGWPWQTYVRSFRIDFFRHFRRVEQRPQRPAENHDVDRQQE